MVRAFGCLLVVLVAVACGTSESPRTDGAKTPGSSVPLREQRPAPLLLISIDGFRHDYRQRAATPNLDRLAREGVVAEGLVHVFPTKTFTTHYSMASGLYAENHGVVANSMWDPERERSFALRNREAVMDPAWYDGEPIWRTAERQGLISGTFFWPGSEAPIGGRHATYWKQYDSSVPHQDRIDQILAWQDLPAAKRPDFMTLYFSRVDSLGHGFGPDAPEVTSAIADMDADLGVLLAGLEARGLLGDLHILVVSDHGMSDIDPERYIFLDDYLAMSGVHVSDWGPAAHVWAGDLDAEAIVEALTDAHPRLRVWKKADTPEHYRFSGHARIADVIVEADHGWMISTRQHMSGRMGPPTRGMHGWDPQHHEMLGIFIGHGPAFRAGSTLPRVESVHLHGLMAHLLGIEPAPNDGTAAAFADVLATELDAGIAPAPATPPLLFGERRPDVDRALSLAAVDGNSPEPGKPITLAGTLDRSCEGDVCQLYLADGEGRLELHLQGFAVPSGTPLGDAVVHGRLEVEGRRVVGLTVTSMLVMAP
ncbi:MAG: alkaline phosphatase family protein [Gammaproteobacteria bacterium]|nr:alkaline phosphatase family protein [Gammaproteobacteria bacterium]